MQAKLTADEFSFLLQALEAQVVIGVDNGRLLPKDQTEREAIFERGKLALIEDGWLTQEGRKLCTHDQLMLLAAVIAESETVLEVTRYTPGGNEQKLFFYFAEEMIVEQFYGADGHYILSQLDGVPAVALRFHRAFQFHNDLTIPGLALSLNRVTFETSMKQAKTGDLAALEYLISTAVNRSPVDVEQISADVSTLRPVGAIAAAAVWQGRPIAAREMVVLRSTNDMIWILSSEDESSMVTLLRLEETLFEKFIRKNIHDMGAIRQHALEALLDDALA